MHSLTSEDSPLFLCNTSKVYHVVLWQWMVTSQSLFDNEGLQKFESSLNKWNQWHIHMIWMPSGLWILKLKVRLNYFYGGVKDIYNAMKAKVIIFTWNISKFSSSLALSYPSLRDAFNHMTWITYVFNDSSLRYNNF